MEPDVTQALGLLQRSNRRNARLGVALLIIATTSLGFNVGRAVTVNKRLAPITAASKAYIENSCPR